MTTHEPTEEEINRIVSHLVVRKRVKEASGPHVIADCPVCGKQEHLYVNVATGLWDCKVCSAAGSAWRLADHLGIRLRDKKLVKSAAQVMLAMTPAPVRLRVRKQVTVVAHDKVESAAARVFAGGDTEGEEVLRYLRGRGLEDVAIQHFKLCVTYIQPGKKLAVGIPYFDDDRCVLMKMRNVDPDCPKSDRFRRTKGGESALFNVGGVRDRRRVVLVEGEIDAVSLWQCGITEVASTSLGAKKEVPQEWREALAAADDIVLWYDDDEAGEDAVAGLVAALGGHRVRIATIPERISADAELVLGKKPKDVNDLVRAGIEPERIRGIVDAAIRIENTQIVRPSAYVDSLAAQIDAGEKTLGISTGWVGLDKLVRGWRPGEVTVVTGHTGHGKSTWVTDVLESLARRGEPVLMSAFEDGPETLARKRFQRLFRRPISSVRTDEDRVAAHEALLALDRDPVYFFDVYGRVPWATVADVVRDAVLRYGCRFIQLDHLHFIVGGDARAEVFAQADQIAMDCAALAVELGCHIFLMAHPRGSVELDTVPTGEGIKNSSSIKQIAFNGITVYRLVDGLGEGHEGKIKLRDATGRRMELDIAKDQSLIYVWKKRHPDARTGTTFLRFNGRDLRYHEDLPPAAADRTEPAGYEAEQQHQDLATDAWGSDGRDPFADVM